MLGYKYFISLMIMDQLLAKLEKIENNRDLLRKTCKINQLPITMLNGFTNSKIQLIYERLLKHYHDHPEKAKTIWFENELKIFFWVVLCISFLQNKKIRDFEDGEWHFIQKIFTEKDLYTFKYETKRILSSGRKNSRVWNAEQNKLLKEIMSDLNMKNKWNEVARIFYSKSGHKYFRTGKQCRQHWLNHLDPSKKHGKWDHQEDLQILKYVFLNGKKWSLIAKQHITHRTEHMIKNRFKALIFQQKKKQGMNENDENKILRRIIRKINQNEKKQQSEMEVDFSYKQAEVQFKTENEIKPVQNQVEKSVLLKAGEAPLNNFNFPNIFPIVYFWSEPFQMLANYYPVNLFQGNVSESLINVNKDGNEQVEQKRIKNNIKVKSIILQETSVNVLEQSIAN